MYDNLRERVGRIQRFAFTIPLTTSTDPTLTVVTRLNKSITFSLYAAKR
jgi:hypothetical protein